MVDAKLWSEDHLSACHWRAFVSGSYKQGGLKSHVILVAFAHHTHFATACNSLQCLPDISSDATPKLDNAEVAFEACFRHHMRSAPRRKNA